VFLLIGLQLPSVLLVVREISIWRLTYYGAIFSVLIILLRLVWTFPGAYISYLIRTRLLHQNMVLPNPREVFLVGWTGMRGVIALAAAVSLPEVLADGKPFPHRELIVFLSFSVILITLVFQGVLLAPVIRLLGLKRPPGAKCDELEGRRIVLTAGLDRLEEIRNGKMHPYPQLLDDMRRQYRRRIDNEAVPREDEVNHVGQYLEYVDLSRELIRVERQAALNLRDEGRIADELLRELEHELDLDEVRLTASLEYGPAAEAAV
jgi:CPA1 family monovalent cation:H+ antiporter